MPKKSIVFLMMATVIICLHEVATASQFDTYIETLNGNRQRLMDHYKVSGPMLTYDLDLAQKAKQVKCSFTPPSGHRVFWVPADKTAVKYWNDQVDDFLERARVDLDEAIDNMGNFPGLLEPLSLGQSKIGCRFKQCTMTSGGVEYKHTAVCVLGPKGTLTAEDLPYEYT